MCQNKHCSNKIGKWMKLVSAEKWVKFRFNYGLSYEDICCSSHPRTVALYSTSLANAICKCNSLVGLHVNIHIGTWTLNIFHVCKSSAWHVGDQSTRQTVSTFIQLYLHAIKMYNIWLSSGHPLCIPPPLFTVIPGRSHRVYPPLVS